MARVPTWTELRMDATKLAKLQEECYQSVRYMLDRAIPEIDRKLALLNGTTSRSRGQRLAKSSSTNFTETQPKQMGTSRTYNNLRELRHNGPALSMDYGGDLPHLYEQIGEPSVPELEQQFNQALNTNEWKKSNDAHGLARTSSPVPQIIKTRELSDEMHDMPTRPKRRQAPKKTVSQSNGHNQEQRVPPTARVKPNLDDLEHLRPLPMPISHYLKINRPDLVKAADRRSMYLRKKAERRRQIATSRNITALDMIRSPSRASSNRGTSSLRSSLRSSTRTVSKDNVAPNYQVRYKLSEHEMKRLTARVYNRLPEVKRQRNEEVTKHRKVQNYKNKMEYGRKLLMNRRQGVINYPLRAHYDDSSVISSQEESFTNSLE